MKKVSEVLRDHRVAHLKGQEVVKVHLHKDQEVTKVQKNKVTEGFKVLVDLMVQQGP